jgi:phosphoribosyl-ATP pyrophosphohydrolase/phosphoribosyl-AMP cyclohydrolase
MIVTLTNLAEVAFGDGQLLPAIAQDIDSGEVLMLAWMNPEALRQTLQRGRAVFWSRSRAALWEKGETSGNTLTLITCHTDCDRDGLLLLVRAHGPACHQGTLTCFAGEALLPRERAALALPFLAKLEAIVTARLTAAEPGSYTAKLASEGPKRLAQKVGEEGLETALAAASGSDTEFIGEAADLLYHLTVALRARGLSLAAVEDELRRRHAARS